jgi:hypothetical protein
MFSATLTSLQEAETLLLGAPQLQLSPIQHNGVKSL